MSALAALQRRFMDALYGHGALDDERADIHRRNLRASLRGALAAAYPVTLRLVGAAFFAGAAERYAGAQPSRSGDLNAYGDGFAGFLEADVHARVLPYLADVARLEWALHECRHGPDATTLDVAALARLPSRSHGALRLLLQPAARLLSSPHPVLALWEANQPGRDGCPQDHAPGPDRLLVRRDGFAARAERVDARDWPLLQALAAGASLEAAAGAMGAAAPTRLAPALARLAADGVIVAFVVPGAP